MERKLELLSPAGNADIAIQAILHGADAVYIGPPSHGARKSAANSLEDIKRTVDFAHIFDAKVYVTVNTLVYDNELSAVEQMIRSLYKIGVDALIIQDMGILRMDIPPIALHASTQCDIRNPEKARFLEEVGFSQLVLARELSLKEIKAICNSVSIPVEVFVHGALCVSYSGRCGAGYAATGRSGNRGECPQICRLPFTLSDSKGRVLARDKYLLSLKDFRAENNLQQLVDAGVTSFKIEGRLKETGYVKNITAFYSRQLNEIVEASEGSLMRTSFGRSELRFIPDPQKSFNRGFTSYRLGGNVDPKGIDSIHTPKSLGEPITDVSSLKPGDGISFFERNGEFSGVQVNAIKNGKIIGNKPFILPKGTEIRRTSSIEWKKLMDGKTAERKLSLDIILDQTGVTARDESGTYIRLNHTVKPQAAQRKTDYKKVFEKLGNTHFQLREFINEVPSLFFPLSYLTDLRRRLAVTLLETKKAVYSYNYRRKENMDFPYPSSTIDYRENVANRLAREFYKEHGVKEIESALEISGKKKASGKSVMTTRQCPLRTLGLCLKKRPPISLPLAMQSGSIRLTPRFNCDACEIDWIYTPDY